MPSHYNMRMLPPKGSLEKPQSSRFAIGAPRTATADSSINTGNDISQTAQRGGIGTQAESPAQELTVTQKKMVAFLAGVVVGLLVNRRK